MEIYIIRHADALPLGEGGSTTDADRPLSPTGKTQARRWPPACSSMACCSATS